MSDPIHVFFNRNSGPTARQQDLIKPVLTVATAAPGRRSPAKKRRPRPTTVRVDTTHENTGQGSEASTNEQPALPSVEPQLGLRPFTMADDALIIAMTQQEIGPIYRESYGHDLEISSVMEYIHAVHSRIITVNDQVAGYVSLVVDGSGRMNIGSLVIDRAFQGKGFGKRIMRQVEQEAKALGLFELEVYIQATNERSRAFARALGFIEVPSTIAQTLILRKSLR